MTIRMADAAESAALRGAVVPALASYVDGRIGDQPNHARVTAAYPGLHHLSIALFATDNADCLDVEPGAALPSQVPGWVARQRARGITRPCLYASVSTMKTAILPLLSSASVAVTSVRLWTAHYEWKPGAAAEHICGPRTCGQLPVDADATQWTDAYRTPAGIVDMSLLADNFFGTAPPVRTITSEVPVQLPTVKQGATGPHVRTIQGLCVARGHVTTVDGVFGGATTLAVKAVQAGKVTADGIVGPATWPVLLGV